MHKKDLIYKNLFSFKNFGFTLAEVLITLAIIGVVAAMTLPTLIQNQQKRSLEVATQKFYSNMSQAVKKYMADEGVDDLRNTPLAGDNYEDSSSTEAIASIQDFLTKYLKVVGECNYKTKECFAKKYNLWNGNYNEYANFTENHSNDAWNNERSYVLADGAVIRIGYYGDQTYPGPIDLYVDINGRKGPNRVGYDLWSMSIFYDGSIDEGELTPECRKENKCDRTNSSAEEREYRFENCKGDDAYGGCFGHFLENGFKFDY